MKRTQGKEEEEKKALALAPRQFIHRARGQLDR
jgi:hypothetical protein